MVRYLLGLVGYSLRPGYNANCNPCPFQFMFLFLFLDSISRSPYNYFFPSSSLSVSLPSFYSPHIAMSVLPLPPLHTDAPFVVLSDWDGTITNMDSNDYLTDNLGFGKQKRRELNTSCLMGHIGFRDSFRQMLESVKTPFPECARILRENVRLDPGFKNFYAYCKENKIPVIIVSSGMTPLIRAVLSNLIGDEEASKIEIIANDVKFTDEKQQGDTWEIVFRHPESEFGHDKSKAILPYANLPNPPTTFFMGDGVSDLSAASHADMLFVKDKGAENDLRDYCVKEKIKHRMFRSFDDVLGDVKSVIEDKKPIAELVSIGDAVNESE